MEVILDGERGPVLKPASAAASVAAWNALTDLGRIARYDTTAVTWHALPNQGLNDGVRALLEGGVAHNQRICDPFARNRTMRQVRLACGG